MKQIVCVFKYLSLRFVHTHTHTHTFIYIYCIARHLYIYIYIYIIIIMSCRQHGYSWPSHVTSPYRSSPLAGPGLQPVSSQYTVNNFYENFNFPLNLTFIVVHYTIKTNFIRYNLLQKSTALKRCDQKYHHNPVAQRAWISLTLSLSFSPLSLSLSLSIHPYYSSLPVGFPNYILCPYRADVNKFLLTGQHWLIHV